MAKRENEDEVLARWGEEARRQGWTMIGRVAGKKVRYRHSCGMRKEVFPASMREGQVRCDQCESTRENWAADASRVGWTLVERLDYRDGVFEHGCGQRIETEMAVLRRGEAKCPVCNQKQRKGCAVKRPGGPEGREQGRMVVL